MTVYSLQCPCANYTRHGHPKEKEEEEAEHAESPAKTNGAKEARHHDGQKNAAERRARVDDAKHSPALTAEPRRCRCHAGVEEGARSERAENRLREEDLVVFNRQRRHHESEAVYGRAQHEQPTWAVRIIQATPLMVVILMSVCGSAWKGQKEKRTTAMLPTWMNTCALAIQLTVLALYDARGPFL